MVQERNLTAVVTGASSGVGLYTAKALTERDNWHVVMACRNLEKAKAAAESVELPEGSFTILPIDLASLDSVRQLSLIHI